MKHTTHFLILLLGFLITGYSQPSLKLVTPDWWGSQGVEEQLEITNARLVIEPQGLYFQVDMYLEFAISPAYTFTDWKEVEYFFDLPKQAVVIDSWLWIENYISKGIIMDADSASQVYNGIVIQQTDPSILLKRSPTRYELRVYPITSTLPRTVKISYLLPAEIDREFMFTTLPFDNISPYLSSTFTVLDVVRDSATSIPQMPEFPGRNFSPFNDPDLGPVYRTYIPRRENTYNNTLAIENHLRDGIYTGTYPTDLNEGIYEVALLPEVVKPDTAIRKVFFLFEFQEGNSSMPERTFKMILEQANIYLREKDLFNFAYFTSSSKFTTGDYSWLSTDSTNLYNSLSVHSNSLYDGNSLENLLTLGLSMLDSLGGGTEVYLYTCNDEIATVYAADQMVSRLGDLEVPIHVANFQDQGFEQVYDPVLDKYVDEKFEYFYEKLAENSGGSYSTLESVGNSVYKLINAPFNTSRASYDLLDLSVSPELGFSYDNIDFGQLDPATNSIRQYGRYYGALPLRIQLFTVKDQIFQVFDTTISNIDITPLSPINERHYHGAYFQSNIGGMTREEATEYSISNRMLCEYTAFLCLEDSVQQGLIAGNPFVWVSIEDELQDLAQDIKVSPNPFQAVQTISIAAEWLDQSGGITMELFDVQGKKVRAFDPDQLLLNGEVYVLDWDGSALPNGIYTLMISTSAEVKSYLISKS